MTYKNTKIIIQVKTEVNTKQELKWQCCKDLWKLIQTENRINGVDINHQKADKLPQSLVM